MVIIIKIHDISRLLGKNSLNYNIFLKKSYCSEEEKVTNEKGEFCSEIFIKGQSMRNPRFIFRA